MKHLSIQICKDPSEAPVYSKEQFKSVELTNAVVVKNGTQEGNPTVDLVFEDNEGNKFVALTTGRILKSLSQCIGSTNNELT